MISNTDSQRFALLFKGKTNTYVRNELPKEKPEPGHKIKTKITNNVSTILGTINLILEKLFNRDEIIKLEKDDNDGAFKIFGKNMLNMFTERAAGFGAIMDTILAVPMLLTSIITVGLVLFIANTLKKLTRINFTEQDKKLIGDNITTIFDIIKAINEKLNEPFNKYTDAQSQEEPWWKKAWKRVVEKNDRIKTIQDGILNTGSLALVYLNTMMLSEIVDDLNKIATFNLKATDVTGKTKEIMDVCRFVADTLKEEKIKRVNVKKVEKVTNIIKMLSESITSLMNITTNQTSITPEGQIDYCLKPLIGIISFMNGTYIVDGKEYTGFNTPTAVNVLIRADGETVVIGGLTRNENQESESGIPFLKDIPILGNLSSCFYFVKRLVAK